MKRHIYLFLLISAFMAVLTSDSPASWSVNGDAAVSGDQVILTPAANDKTGSAWIDTKIDLSKDFDISFKINLGNNDGGADGISFALHNDPAGTGAFGDINGGGEWVGMNKICPALGIEVDTYRNGLRGDPAEDHLGINLYRSSGTDCIGEPEHNAAGPVQAGNSANIEDGAEHDFRITWNALSMRMEVFFDGISRLAYTGDIITDLFSGVSEVYIGYTASTGGAYNRQYILAGNAAVDAEKSVTPKLFSKSTNPKTARYTIDIINNGSVTAFGTQITDTLPEGVTYVSGSTTGASVFDPLIDISPVSGRQILHWNLSALPVVPNGGRQSVSFEALLPDAAGTYTNDFSVSGDNFSKISKTVRASVLVGPSDLAVTTGYPGVFTTGKSGSFTLDVINNGPDPAEDITITCRLPDGISYLSHTGTGWVVNADAAPLIKWTGKGSLAAGTDAPTLIVTVDVGIAAYPEITNYVSAESSNPDPDMNNNEASDTIIVKRPEVDLEIQMNHANTFNEGVPGNYEIVVSNIGRDDEPGPVAVRDDLPQGMSYSGFTGTSWSEEIVSETEIIWRHPGPLPEGTSLPPIILSLTPDSAAVPHVTNTVTVKGVAADNNATNNSSSDLTTVLGADAGNKPLYLSSNKKLSRKMPSSSGSVKINGDNKSVSWRLGNPLAKNLLLASGRHPVRLYLERSFWPGTREITVSLASSDRTIGSLGSPVTLAVDIPNFGTAGIVERVFNIELPVPVTLPAGSFIEMKVSNNTPNRFMQILVHSESLGRFSGVELNSLTVIEIESINACDSAYPAAPAPPSYFLPGDIVYIRAVVSDPFGSYDITGAGIDIVNPSGITIISGAPMGEVDDSLGSEKTYEYEFQTAGGADGVWTARVTAFEGNENIVTDVETAVFVVSQPMPDLTVLKSVNTHSDPVNNTTNPKAIPGAVVTYSIIVTNTGPKGVDNDSFVVADLLPPNTELFINPPAGPVSFIDSGSGLDYLYSRDMEFFSGGSPYSPLPDASGYDGNVTSFKVNPKGAFAPYSGAGSAPSCRLIFRVRIK